MVSVRHPSQPGNRANLPDRVLMKADGLDERQCHNLANIAVAYARRFAPKLSGASARRMQPVWGEGWFGIHWVDPYVWFQEQGIRPFTMSKLAGKTIPMWVNDPTGEVYRRERGSPYRKDGKTPRKQPDIRTRVTDDGRRQTQIFRRAAKQGQRKNVTRRRGGQQRIVNVPAAYPGAPGRISQREAPMKMVPGGSGGRIARGNVGVRWRHPGMTTKGFLADAMTAAAMRAGIDVTQIYSTNANWKF